MTKLTLRFQLLSPLDEKLMASISRTGSVYGLARVQVSPKLDCLIVDFDASRLTVDDVERELAKAGIPAQRSPPGQLRFPEV